MDYRTVRARVRKPTERQKKAAENLGKGMSIKQAMLDAGYAPATAHLGMQAVPMTVQVLGIKGSDTWRVGRGMTVEDLKYLALGRLAKNMAEGKDGGVMSAKTAGSHRELNLWQSESQVGVLVVNAPDSGVKLAPVPDEVPSKD